jgi:hypothetical protein
LWRALSDPSLNIFGRGEQENYLFENHELFVDGIRMTYKATNLIENEQNFIVKSGGTIVLNPKSDSRYCIVLEKITHLTDVHL